MAGTSDLAVIGREGSTRGGPSRPRGRARAWGTIRGASETASRGTTHVPVRLPYRRRIHTPMTSRPRQGSNRSRTWEDRDRRNVLLNVAFIGTIAVAVLLLVLAWGATWYNDHLSSAASVNGQTITRDAFAKQVAVNQFRADYQSRRLRTLLAANHLRSTDADSRKALIDQGLQQVATISLEQLVDGTIQADLAGSRASWCPRTTSPRVSRGGHQPELRHAWMIAVAPELASGASTPTDAAVAAAKAKAEKALADLKAGGDWATIAKDVSSDATAAQGGDMGFIDKDSSIDPAFRTALLAAAKDAPTEIVAGADGTFRIGRVTEIIAPDVDATLEQQVKDAGIDVNDFRAAFRRELTRTRLEDAILAPYIAPGPQRDVNEILLEAGQSESGPGAIRVRHILYSPNGDPSTASTVAADDPAWAAAKAKADATYAKLKADPTLFDSIARAESDERRPVTTGGKLPYFSTEDAIDPAFWAAISPPGLQPGQLLEPVKSAFGYHVIQVQRFPTDAEFAAKLKQDLTQADRHVRGRGARQLRRSGPPRAASSAGSPRASSPRRSRTRSSRHRSARSPTRSPSRARASHLPGDRGGDPDAHRGAEHRSRARSSGLVHHPEGRRSRSRATRPSPAPPADAAGEGRRCWTHSWPRPPALGPGPARRAGRRGRRAACRHADRANAAAPRACRQPGSARTRSGGGAPAAARPPRPGGADAGRRVAPPVPGRPPGRPVRQPRGHHDRRAHRRRSRGTAVPAPGGARAGVASPWGMPWISDRLRAPDGCPWDREQTHESLRNHLLEEAYEVYDALEGGATPELAGELGDLCSRSSSTHSSPPRQGVFDMTDVWAAIASKIVRRHPHVFGETEARTAADVNRQWERIKQGERARPPPGAGGHGLPKSALDGISRSLPALAASQEMQERAAHLGYDWPSIDGVLDKVREEVGELVEAESDAHRAEELGDLLFVLDNVGRKTGIEVEAALRGANDKFRRRFRHVELGAAARGTALRDMTFEELDALWDAAKAAERGRHLHEHRQPAAVRRWHRQSWARARGRPPARRSAARSRSRWASRSGPRARASSVSATRRSSAPPRSRTGSRRTCAARARAGSRARTRCCRAPPPSAPSASRPRARSAGGPTRSSAWSDGRCAGSWTPRGWASARSRSTATSSRPTAAPAPRPSPAATSPWPRR